MAWSAQSCVHAAWLPLVLVLACAGASAQQPDDRMLSLLRQVNDTTNRRYVQVEELANRWSSPDELRRSGRGDCEDFAIAKYTMLRLAGMATEMCVTQTAIAARELGFKVTVIPGACACVDERLERIALEYLRDVVGVRLEP